MKRMYFIGVSTGQSQIRRLFPLWTALAGVAEAELEGIDIPVGAAPEAYREAVRRITDDADGAGALVTSHKVGIYNHAHELFTEFDDDARLLRELSCIVRRGARVSGQALDVLNSGLALRAIIEPPFRGPALILGAGGAGVALAVQLERHHKPACTILSDVDAERIRFARTVTPAKCVTVDDARDNDRLLRAMPRAALVVNATGMGKDRPGCPLTPGCRFPPDAIAWDFNYRGDLLFLDYARAQGVRVVDGWEYFLHGWTQIMSRVLGFDLDDERFRRMEAVAGR